MSTVYRHTHGSPRGVTADVRPSRRASTTESLCAGEFANPPSALLLDDLRGGTTLTPLPGGLRHFYTTSVPPPGVTSRRAPSSEGLTRNEGGPVGTKPFLNRPPTTEVTVRTSGGSDVSADFFRTL